ncbi:hypothetical protein L6164_009472 [Bauhinia variegata]|uniref:Uncharacterized protein n=1 Tax=Bauhinia variegata TaxID=167791 RepID=A0ACB9PIU2_BAUVA|nr:hypothetical protein L6164_009472 [Bauhinia variegata]
MIIRMLTSFPYPGKCRSEESRTVKAGMKTESSIPYIIWGHDQSISPHCIHPSNPICKTNHPLLSMCCTRSSYETHAPNGRSASKATRHL